MRKIILKLKEYFKTLEEIRIHREKVNRTMRELSSLSDYELQDIGINRGMIMSVAKETL